MSRNMINSSANIVQRFWNFCNILRDDGVSYSDYVEQLTYLLFLKLADEQTNPPFNKPPIMPNGLDWQSLLSEQDSKLETKYQHILNTLGKEPGMLRVIFYKSQNRIQDPAKLRRLINLINGETWIGLDIDIKGAIYEGLLEKNAEDVKSGAGQYFTPRTLIRAIVQVVRPKPGETVHDPACGTGGFLLVAYDYVKDNYSLDEVQERVLEHETFSGKDIVENVVKLCAMNLFLHGIGAEECPIEVGDSLRSDPKKRYDLVLTNPPFGKKSSVTIVNGDGKVDKQYMNYNRQDFSATSSNKQLNFLQHVRTILKINGRAAVVVPDNVLFEGEASETVRKKILRQCDVHTLLRLPTGVFYAQGVKANVLFFDKKPPSKRAWTEKLWVYDLRTNMHLTHKEKPLTDEDLQDFIKCFNPMNRHQREESERFKAFSYGELMKRDRTNLDIFWLRDESVDESESLPDPEILAARIVDCLENALEQFKLLNEE